MASLAAYLANHDTFAQLAVEDLNGGVNWTIDGVNYFESKWNSHSVSLSHPLLLSCSDRTVTLERHDSKADIQTTLEIYQGIRENLKVQAISA